MFSTPSWGATSSSSNGEVRLVDFCRSNEEDGSIVSAKTELV